LAFDNMQDRPITGTKDWTRYEVVVDVAPEATDIAFGALLSGSGHLWIDDLAFEIVGPKVPTTGLGGTAPGETPKPAANLDFEHL
jgi:hypothetical protein